MELKNVSTPTPMDLKVDVMKENTKEMIAANDSARVLNTVTSVN